MTPLAHTLRVWSQASERVVSNVIEANRATASALGFDPSTLSTPSNRSEPTLDGPHPEIPTIADHTPGWDHDRTVDEPSSIDVGDVVTFSKTITETDVREFASASGDTNRLHLDESFADETRFGERIVHGTLVAGLISAALARMPGLTVYLSQDLEFVGPVAIGDRLTASVEVAEDLGGDRYRLETVVETDEDVVIGGEAVVLIDPVPESIREETDSATEVE
ncbi:MaoC family dehydratase [Natrialbaceae archaeon GCM10025810]|uniref:MaoC family dehydratase n=1 Tax=Halovalidus salilacus TaxID=3075124 RepID=UPI00360736B4